MIQKTLGSNQQGEEVALEHNFMIPPASGVHEYFLLDECSTLGPFSHSTHSSREIIFQWKERNINKISKE